MSSLQSVSNGDIELHPVCFYTSSLTPHQRHYPGNISKSNSSSRSAASTEERPERQPVHFHSHSWRSIFRCPPHGHSPVYFPLKANYIAAVLGQTKLLYFKHKLALTHVCFTPPHTYTSSHTLTCTKGKTNTCSSSSYCSRRHQQWLLTWLWQKVLTYTHRKVWGCFVFSFSFSHQEAS